MVKKIVGQRLKLHKKFSGKNCMKNIVRKVLIQKLPEKIVRKICIKNFQKKVLEIKV